MENAEIELQDNSFFSQRTHGVRPSEASTQPHREKTPSRKEAIRMGFNSKPPTPDAKTFLKSLTVL